MKIKLLLSFLLISFGISIVVAQKAKGKSGIIRVQKVKLKDYDPKVVKYDMKEYYSVEKNILIPAKGMQMWYSKKYGQFFIINAEAQEETGII